MGSSSTTGGTGGASDCDCEFRPIVSSKDLLDIRMRMMMPAAGQTIDWRKHPTKELLRMPTSKPEIKIVNSQPRHELLAEAVAVLAQQRHDEPEGEDKTCDLLLICEDGRVALHRILLQNMLNQHHPEGPNDPAPNSLIKVLQDALEPGGGGEATVAITLAGVKVAHVKAVVSLIYGGIYAPISDGDVGEVKVVIDLLQLGPMWSGLMMEKVEEDQGTRNNNLEQSTSQLFRSTDVTGSSDLGDPGTTFNSDDDPSPSSLLATESESSTEAVPPPPPPPLSGANNAAAGNGEAQVDGGGDAESQSLENSVGISKQVQNDGVGETSAPAPDKEEENQTTIIENDPDIGQQHDKLGKSTRCGSTPVNAVASDTLEVHVVDDELPGSSSSCRTTTTWAEPLLPLTLPAVKRNAEHNAKDDATTAISPSSQVKKEMEEVVPPPPLPRQALIKEETTTSSTPDEMRVQDHLIPTNRLHPTSRSIHCRGSSSFRMPPPNVPYKQSRPRKRRRTEKMATTPPESANNNASAENKLTIRRRRLRATRSPVQSFGGGGKKKKRGGNSSNKCRIRAAANRVDDTDDDDDEEGNLELLKEEATPPCSNHKRYLLRPRKKAKKEIESDADAKRMRIRVHRVMDTDSSELSNTDSDADLFEKIGSHSESHHQSRNRKRYSRSPNPNPNCGKPHQRQHHHHLLQKELKVGITRLEEDKLLMQQQREVGGFASKKRPKLSITTTGSPPPPDDDGHRKGDGDCNSPLDLERRRMVENVGDNCIGGVTCGAPAVHDDDDDSTGGREEEFGVVEQVRRRESEKEERRRRHNTAGEEESLVEPHAAVVVGVEVEQSVRASGSRSRDNGAAETEKEVVPMMTNNNGIVESEGHHHPVADDVSIKLEAPDRPDPPVTLEAPDRPDSPRNSPRLP